MIDRIFTSFISSTFTDLRQQRELIADQLLGQGCMPIGMEFFPSTGQPLPRVIEDSIGRSDFYLLVIAGRYGSLSPSGRSWTEEEFNIARSLDKEIIALVHDNPGNIRAADVDKSPTMAVALSDFRERVMRTVTWLPWRDDTSLVGAVARSVADCIRQSRIHGWVRESDPVSSIQPEDFDRRYLLVESIHQYRLSGTCPGAWDTDYEGHRVVTAHWSEGLSRLTIDFDRGSDQMLPFTTDRYPRLRLRPGWTRSDSGDIRLTSTPRKSTGSSFAQDVKFDPPLRRGETADFWIDGEIEAYRVGSLEQLVKTTEHTVGGRRSFDMMARRIGFPTDRVVLRAFLPDELGATPLGPRVGRSQIVVYPEEEQRIAAVNGYWKERVILNGREGTLMTLELENPKMFARYRLAWAPPQSSPTSNPPSS